MGNSRFNQRLFRPVFNGFPGRRYIAFKLRPARPTDVHFRLLKQCVKFENELDLGISGFDLPRILELAKRT